MSAPTTATPPVEPAHVRTCETLGRWPHEVDPAAYHGGLDAMAEDRVDLGTPLGRSLDKIRAIPPATDEEAPAEHPLSVALSDRWRWLWLREAAPIALALQGGLAIGMTGQHLIEGTDTGGRYTAKLVPAVRHENTPSAES